MTHKAWWRGLVCFTLCSVLFLHTALPLFDSLLEQCGRLCWDSCRCCRLLMAPVFLHVCCVLSGAFSEAEWTYVRREQYCFKGPVLTATNIRVQNFLSLLAVREDRLRTYKRNIEARSHSRCLPRKSSTRYVFCVCVCSPGYFSL